VETLSAADSASHAHVDARLAPHDAPGRDVDQRDVDVDERGDEADRALAGVVILEFGRAVEIEAQAFDAAAADPALHDPHARLAVMLGHQQQVCRSFALHGGVDLCRQRHPAAVEDAVLVGEVLGPRCRQQRDLRARHLRLQRSIDGAQGGEVEFVLRQGERVVRIGVQLRPRGHLVGDHVELVADEGQHRVARRRMGGAAQQQARDRREQVSLHSLSPCCVTRQDRIIAVPALAETGETEDGLNPASFDARQPRSAQPGRRRFGQDV